MVERITIDSSVIIAALREQEPKHKECKSLLQKVKFEIVSTRAHRAAEIAKDTGVRGMDAIVIQIAREFNVPLVSLDTEMLERSKSIINIKEINCL